MEKRSKDCKSVQMDGLNKGKNMFECCSKTFQF